MPQVTVIATFNPKGGQEQELEQILTDMVRPTCSGRCGPHYHLYITNNRSPASFLLFEVYRDQGSLEAHRATSNYKAYRERIAELLSTPTKVVVLQGIDVTGASSVVAIRSTGVAGASYNSGKQMASARLR